MSRVCVLDRVELVRDPEFRGRVHTVYPDRTVRVAWEDGKYTRISTEDLRVVERPK